MGVEKVSRQAVILLREQNPNLTLQEIGEEAPAVAGWGEPITRERVRQILTIAKKPTASSLQRRRAHCYQCGAPATKSSLFETTFQGKRVYRCYNCRRKVRKKRQRRKYVAKRCLLCREKFVVPWWRRRQKCCSVTCRLKKASLCRWADR